MNKVLHDHFLFVPSDSKNNHRNYIFERIVQNMICGKFFCEEISTVYIGLNDKKLRMFNKVRHPKTSLTKISMKAILQSSLSSS